MADSITISTELWEFIGQSFLLAMGVIITVKLIPHFTNKYHEKQKQLDVDREIREKELDIQREKRQRDLDREREDRKHQLQIQQYLLEKISSNFADGYLILVIHKHSNEKKKFEFSNKDYTKYLVDTITIQSLLKLYYTEQSDVFIQFERLNSTLIWALDIRMDESLGIIDINEQIRSLKIIFSEHEFPKNLETSIKNLKEKGFMNLFDKLMVGELYSLLNLLKNTKPIIG